MTGVDLKNETVSLTDLANASGSDKGTSGHPFPHHYTRIMTCCFSRTGTVLRICWRSVLWREDRRWAATLIGSSVPRLRSICS